MSHDTVRLDVLVKLLGRAYDAAFGDALADLSTTRLEFAMLGVLGNGPLPWEELESRMPTGTSPAAATDAWNGLVAGGWAVEDDGLRAITPDGRTALADLHAAIEDIHAQAVGDLDDATLDATAAAVRAMLANLDR